MYPFIETIRMSEGQLCQLDYHQERLNRTLAHFFPLASPIRLADTLDALPHPPTGTFKVRVVYGPSIIQTEVCPYTPRTIRTLRLVTDNNIDYTFKSTDRRDLEELRNQCHGADEIIIVRNGLITDTSYSNLAFYDGDTWKTPASPLLKGTMRQFLIDTNQIKEDDITPADLDLYEKVCLINAMMPLGVCEVDMKAKAVFIV